MNFLIVQLLSEDALNVVEHPVVAIDLVLHA
jgi:hypothetical protein